MTFGRFNVTIGCPSPIWIELSDVNDPSVALRFYASNLPALYAAIDHAKHECRRIAIDFPSQVEGKRIRAQIGDVP